MLEPRSRRTRGGIVGLAVCLLAPMVVAGDLPRTAASRGGGSPTVPSDPNFDTLLSDGSVVSGRLIQVDPARGVTLAGPSGEERTLPVDRVVKLTREGTLTAPTVEGDLVVLSGGDRLTRCVIGASGNLTLAVQPVAFGRLAIPLDGILGLLVAPPSDVDALNTLETKVRTEPRTAERIWLANGDKLDGLFAGLTEKQVAFQPPGGKIDVARSGVVAIGFDPSQVAAETPKGPYYEWLLIDGSRLGLDQSRIERGQVVGQTGFGVEVRFPIGEVARVRVLNSSVVYLSDRPADRVIYEPYLGPTRPYRRDSSVNGPALRLGGQTFDRGLGTQSRTLLAYRIAPGARRFQATVGLDDAAGALGNVMFKVLVDGKPRFESPLMGAGDPPKSVDIDLNDGKVLILITEFGERGDVQDSGDWVEARIIR